MNYDVTVGLLFTTHNYILLWNHKEKTLRAPNSHDCDVLFGDLKFKFCIEQNTITFLRCHYHSLSIVMLI